MATDAPVRGGRNPEFLLIGAMKSGTTTLFEYLCRHPEIFMCTPKEPGFFSRTQVYARGMDWYTELFADATPNQRCGEASTCYSRWPHYGDVAARVAKHLPDVKLVYLMRHPVERAYSHYRHSMQERRNVPESSIPSFEEAIECIPEILDASLYRVQLDQYLAHFPREQIHCLTLDELKSDPDATLAAIQRFLGVEQLPLTEQGPVSANADGSAAARRSAHQFMRHVRTMPGWTRLAGLLPPSLRERIRQRIADPRLASRLFRGRVEQGRAELSPLAEETRVALLRRFDEPTRQIAEFLQRDLEAWTR